MVGCRCLSNPARQFFFLFFPPPKVLLLSLHAHFGAVPRYVGVACFELKHFTPRANNRFPLHWSRFCKEDLCVPDVVWSSSSCFRVGPVQSAWSTVARVLWVGTVTTNADPAQPLTTAGEKLDGLDHDQSVRPVKHFSLAEGSSTVATEELPNHCIFGSDVYFYYCTVIR